MEFHFVALALGDIFWIGLAFLFGLVARALGLPPLVGFLATGFVLNVYGAVSGDILQKLADLGITLLLFTIGLKLNLRSLIRPQVWAVTTLHMAVVVLGFGFALYGIALLASGWIAGLELPAALLIAFALSFSSTVFVAKVLEERGEMTSTHGRIAIGILVMQDLVAVIFLAISKGVVPSPWAFLVLLLIPLRPLLHRLLDRVGHGELLVLYGFILALGGAEAFESVELKGDLGALVLGVLIASHPKAEEMSKTMLGFKDLFLLGFFLNVGLAGQPALSHFLVGAALTPFIFLKSALFFWMLTRFRLRARTSLLAAINLTNYSEFGLIVAAIGAANGWIAPDWLIVIAIALALSFVVASGLSQGANRIYASQRARWLKYQRDDLVSEDRLIDVRGTRVAIIGMGGVGTGAYEKLRERYGDTLLGVDMDPVTVNSHVLDGRRVLLGDPSDSDFWDRLHASDSLELVMLTLPRTRTSMAVISQLKAAGFQGRIAAIARFPDQEQMLTLAGATTVFNIYSEAGAGFAAHVLAADPSP